MRVGFGTTFTFLGPEARVQSVIGRFKGWADSHYGAGEVTLKANVLTTPFPQFSDDEYTALQGSYSAMPPKNEEAIRNANGHNQNTVTIDLN